MNNKIKIYAVIADYRPKNPKKPMYYVRANSKKEAKELFNSKISWLKIYDVHELNKDELKDLLAKGPMGYILF